MKHMLTSAVVAGFAAGLLAALLHFAFVQKLILVGEQYESGAIVHFAGLADVAAEAGHDHDAHSHDDTAAMDAPAEAGHDHTHSHEASEASTTTRNILTSLFYGLTYVAYALILVAGFNLATSNGYAIDAPRGMLWGLAGFAVFQMAPAMGLAPELPGTMAADLFARQMWWLGTAAATAVGLGLLGYGRSALAIAAGLVLLVAPHVVGAPTPEGYSGIAPPELASAFAARALGVGLIAWVFLGGLAARLWATKPMNSAVY